MGIAQSTAAVATAAQVSAAFLYILDMMFSLNVAATAMGAWGRNAPSVIWFHFDRSE
jgi:hypothetical protein